uniref:Fzd-4-1b n=1 Tax=Dendrocoelum lacteum TaxID=27895 RepID=T1DF93_9PLAT
MYKMNLIVLIWYGIFILRIDSRRNDKMSIDVYGQCSLITEPVCQDIQYTHTKMPNLIGILSQEEASKRIRDYYALINLQCSQYLKLYLCSVYFPVCDKVTPISENIQPCRRLCHHVKSRCEPFMQNTYQLTWPDELNCEKLPESTKLCVAPDSFSLDKDHNKMSNYVEMKKKLFEQLKVSMDKSGNDFPKIEMLKKVNLLSDLKCLPSQFIIGETPNISCAQNCDADVKFNDNDKTFANIWLIIWSLLCLLSSLFTIITFSCNTNRFMYPEKPIVFLSICYFFHSCGNLLGVILGRRNVICRPFSEQFDFIVGNGNETTWCKIIFLMVYFFSSASALWWVVLTVTWFLSASRHWGNEAIESISSILHLLSWGIPALKSIFVLILHKIDADELTGQCFVGNNDKEALIGFVLIPQIIYLLIGMIFLGLGYYSILKVRKSFLQQPNCIDTNNIKRLEKLMAKIGVFSILYIIPVTCTIASYVIDVLKTSYFDLILNVVYTFSPDCVTAKGLSWSQTKCLKLIQSALPSVEMRMLRIFMTLVIGITSGIWIWGNKKTFRNCCCILNNLNRTKDIQLKEMKPTDFLNPLSSLSNKNPSDSNINSQRWNYSPTLQSAQTFTGTNITCTEGIAAPNNSSISGTSSKH